MPTLHSSTLDSTRRQPSNLNDRLDKRLLAYMAAAGAAGVSVLAMTQPANAKVVYTKTNQLITWNGEKIDLNHDGTPDFGFDGYGIGNYFAGDVAPLRFNKMMSYAKPLPAGVSVGPGGKFEAGREMMVGDFANSVSTAFLGPWIGVQNEYMGFEFNIKGAAHFGWARFSVTDQGGVTLTGYAYETVSLKPIVTGDTGAGDSSEDEKSQTAPAEETPTPTLGVLARGAAGLAMRRDLN
jgi:hypothetical protein